MDGAPQRDFSDGPGGVVREVGGEDADPELPLEDRDTEFSP